LGFKGLDGWTPERQRLFLVALAALGTVDSTL